MYEQPGANSAIVTAFLRGLAQSIASLPEPNHQILLEALPMHVGSMNVPSEGDRRRLEGLLQALTMYVDQAQRHP